ncbi:uncharacterized protein LY89DRAFT_238991 [Mollisia scopiformis]|uniref:Uncharacterized protein n=1 Tax=Mollisia scopiformis TaxID=149040 RepID=A0A194WU15_MOLSC|nr:uncharacterized protein LY89DRAFT_238991 [Mollisia scopiformis]KUJ11174.1 hypothetical protein LY89DRAFT_238991 [Mollisia scopiformis]
MGLIVCRGVEIPRLSPGLVDVDIEKMVQTFDNFSIQELDDLQYIDTIPFNGVNRSILAFFSGLFKFLERMVHKSESTRCFEEGSAAYSRDLAMSMATSPELLGNEVPNRVGSLSAEIFRHDARNADYRCFPRKLQEGKWTFMLISDVPDGLENSTKYPLWRYAFITAAPSHRGSKRKAPGFGFEGENCPSSTWNRLPRSTPDIVIADIGAYLGSIIPSEAMGVKDTRQKVLEAWQAAMWRKIEVTYRRRGGPDRKRTSWKRPKLCSRKEVESWLGSSDFDEAKQEKWRKDRLEMRS